MTMDRHPTTATWVLPPDDRAPLPAPLRRTNLRQLAARPDRFEHHLMVVARVGDTQLEIATASEPLYFAHRNISDEYAVPLGTGDALLDSFPFRTFFADLETGADVGRVNHRCEQLVLHPHGILHWPGKLRPPYATFDFAPGMRRAGLTLVYCAWQPCAPVERPLFVSAGNEGAVKTYGGAEVPFLLAELAREPSRALAAVGQTRLELAVEPTVIGPPGGGYAVVVDGDGVDAFPGDLVYVPAGASYAARGVARALVVTGAAPEPPPPSWDAAPAPPFAVYEAARPGALPIEVHGVAVTDAGDGQAEVAIGASRARVPRYWLARFLFRTALHEFRLGYLETYGGFTYDDQAGVVRLGIRGGDSVDIAMGDAARAIEALYRAVAPAGYIERLS